VIYYRKLKQCNHKISIWSM